MNPSSERSADCTQESSPAAEPTHAFAMTVQELSQTVKKLSNVVAQLSEEKASSLDDNDNEDKKILNEEEAWETVRDMIKEQDDATVESWKDELDNLLVFAGLFSAVVTAFTVESYAWLQQDSSDAANMLLARLSLQLSALTVAFVNSNSADNGFINSTAPALTLSDVSTSFVPVAYAVPVNALWVLSLTLSLISAFFAIAAQQWLRQLHLPSDMPVRRAVQLQAFRKDGLKTWQLSSIIALLPLLLQIAVVLFLVGLFLLLQSLNTTITVAFGVVALVALIAFLFTTVVPLLTVRCPYKSPVIPTVLVMLQCLSYPLTVVGVPIAFWLQFMFLFVRLAIDHNMEALYRRTDLLIHFNEATLPGRLVAYLRSFGRHILVDFGQFWLSREYQHLISCSRIAKLERASLIQTVLSVPSRRLSTLLQSFESFKKEDWTYTFRDTVVQSLGAFRSGLKWDDIMPDLWFGDVEIVSYIRGWFSSRHHHLLLHLSQCHEWTEVKRAESVMLQLFHELDEATSSTRQRYAKHLIHVCAAHQISDPCSQWELVPTCLLLDTILDRRCTLDKDDIAAIHSSTSEVYEAIHSRSANIDFEWNWNSLICAKTTLTLLSACYNDVTPYASTSAIVKMFSEYLDNDGTLETLKMGTRICHYGAALSYTRSISFIRIQEFLCKALADYASLNTLPSDISHLQHLVRISFNLREFWQNQASDVRRILNETDGHTHLDRLDVALAAYKERLTSDDERNGEEHEGSCTGGEAGIMESTVDHS